MQFTHTRTPTLNDNVAYPAIIGKTLVNIRKTDGLATNSSPISLAGGCPTSLHIEIRGKRVSTYLERTSNIQRRPTPCTTSTSSSRWRCFLYSRIAWIPSHDRKEAYTKTKVRHIYASNGCRSTLCQEGFW